MTHPMTAKKFAEKLETRHKDFSKQIDDQTKTFFQPEKGDNGEKTGELKTHYDNYEKLLREHNDEFRRRAKDLNEAALKRFEELLESHRTVEGSGSL
jgi:hypothetical protein